MAERRQSTGMICSTIINAAPFRTEQAKTVGPMDVFPDESQEPPEQTPEDHQVMLSGFFARFKRPKP